MPERYREAKTNLESRYASAVGRSGSRTHERRASAALGIDALEHDEAEHEK
jgi:hypothetical protein